MAASSSAAHTSRVMPPRTGDGLHSALAQGVEQKSHNCTHASCALLHYMKPSHFHEGRSTDVRLQPV